MRKKGISFDEIMDMYAYKVIVPNRIDCYVALGKVHELYKPIPQRFKDYIATPKANGYRSIHTVVSGPYNIPLEIQIKTEQMDRQAEYGIAAHWSYKIGEKQIKPYKDGLRKFLILTFIQPVQLNFWKMSKQMYLIMMFLSLLLKEKLLSYL